MKKLLFIATLLLTLGLFFTACSDSKNAKTEQLAAGETYTCTMHNEVMSDHPGKCPKCGMNLVKQQMTDEQKQIERNGEFCKAE